MGEFFDTLVDVIFIVALCVAPVMLLADPVSTPNNWARAIAATNAAIEALDWPTPQMVDAGYAAKDDDNLSITSIWQAMLAASSAE